MGGPSAGCVSEGFSPLPEPCTFPFSATTGFCGSALRLGMDESLYSKSCVNASNLCICLFSLSNLSFALTANWFRNCTVETTNALMIVMDFLGSMAAAIKTIEMLGLHARRSVAFSAQLLTSLKLEPLTETKELLVSSNRVKLTFVPAAEIEPVPTLAIAEVQRFMDALPGSSESLSPKLEKHLQTVNPTIKEMHQEEEASRLWVKEFLDPGPTATISKHENIDESTYPGAVPLSSIKNYMKQIERMNKHRYRGNLNKEAEKLRVKDFDMSEIKFYPGSALGPDPEDDPETWVKWYLSNQPKSLYPNGETWKPEDVLLEEAGPEEQDQDEEEASKVEDDAEVEEDDILEDFEDEDLNSDLGEGAEIFSSKPIKQNVVFDNPESFLTSNYDIEEFRKSKPEREYMEKEDKGIFSMSSPMATPDELPIAPSVVSPEHEKSMYDIDRWAVFRMMPLLLNYKAQVNTFLKKLQESETVPVSVSLPSVIPYFETLPKWYQQQRVVQGVVAGLERFKPEMSRLEKETLINELCYYITPKDPKRLLFLQEFYQKKLVPTEAELEEGDEEEEIATKRKLAMEEETAETKILRILGEESGARNEGYQEIKDIPDFKVDWHTLDLENPKGDLPITLTYYDNEDGFWNDWIQAKRDRMGPPVIVDRKFFKH